MTRHGFFRTRIRLTAFLTGAILFWSVAAFAITPTLGEDCGTGASIVGSDQAGKVTLGEGPTTCTLGFFTPFVNPPACIAVNETNGGGSASAATLGMRSTKTTAVVDGRTPVTEGDVISYLCLGY